MTVADVARPNRHPGLAYFERLCEAFEEASGAAGGAIEQTLEIGGVGVRLRFAGAELVPRLLPSIVHLTSARANDAQGGTIRVWDSASTRVSVPRFPWLPRDVMQLGKIRGYNDSQVRTVFHGNLNEPGHGFNALSMFEARSGSGVFWTAGPDRLPWWEPTAPLRAVFGWMLAARGRHLIHGAAVGRGGRGVLLAGKGGSGKSTTALACLEAGFEYVGDDYVALSMDGAPVAHSVYGMAKLPFHGLDRVPGLPRLRADKAADGEKAVVHVGQWRPDLLRKSLAIDAVLMPQVTGGRKSSLRPTGRSEAIRALAPSTIFQLPQDGEIVLRAIAGLARAVPAFFLELGADLSAVPALLEELLGDPPARRPLSGEP